MIQKALNFQTSILSYRNINIPSQMVVLKDDIIVRAEKIKNSVGELTETGRFNLTFKVYDRPFIEMVINNNGTEIGSPITIE